MLLLSKDRLVKTRKFNEPRYVGDPINIARIFNDKEADELIVLDIDATRDNKDPQYELIEELASECFMPLCYGGGIKSVEQARTILRLGVEKVCIQSAAFQDPKLITQLSDIFGSQAIVFSIDLHRGSDGNLRLYDSVNRTVVGDDWRSFLMNLSGLGVGEIIVTSVDREGLKTGLDLELIRSISSEVNVPLIAHGGVGTLGHVKEGLAAGADAIASGSFLVFHGKHDAVLISYPTGVSLDDS